MPKQFWQTRFYDFNVWSREKEREKLEYMHANPVQNKLVANPRDCPGAVCRITQRASRAC
jgi:putative transposase